MGSHRSTARHGRRLGPLGGLGLVAALLVGACGGGGTASTPAPAATPAGLAMPVPAVATTAVLADFLRQVGGDAVAATALVPPGADVHTFRPAPRDSLRIREARLIVLNGAGLDDFLRDEIEAARRPGAVIVVAAEAEGDPHQWLDPVLAAGYVERIREGLVRADPGRAEAYRRNAAAYLDRLRALDAEIRRTLEAIPGSRRVLVTFHDAFEYFARRYGLRPLALAGPGGGDVTPRDVADIIERVRRAGVPAVFAEPQFDQDVLRRVAADTRAAIGLIRSDTLDAGAPTYVEMMRANARSLARLLAPGGEGAP